jgi:hypothetical protein
MNLLSGLTVLRDWESRSISAENPDGSKAGGARAVPVGGPARELGMGWKVRPCVDLPSGQTLTLADIAGPGTIQHIWMTVDARAYRDCILRFFWDEEETPSVEVPLGDFFANGHGLRCSVNSLMVAVNPMGGFNCYWPMPFARRALLTIENQGEQEVKDFFYQVDYALGELPAGLAYFHAQWRIGMTRREHPEHIILDGVRGDGQYVGSYLAWTQCSDGWWGEGEVKFYLDGDGEHPTICGTGTEDYFGGAWCFGETFCAPFSGYPLWQREAGRVPKHGLYRWHVLDPIRFRRDLRVTVQSLGWWPGGLYQPLTDEIASTAFWYQRDPHAPFPSLLPRDARRPRS